MSVFETDDDAASFVRWVDGLSRRPHRAVERAADEAEERLLAAGWSRHGYVGEELVPPGAIYDWSLGVFPPDDPRVIAGNWVCQCGFETDRLEWAEGHTQYAQEGRALDRPGPHQITEIARYGPMHREWGEE